MTIGAIVFLLAVGLAGVALAAAGIVIAVRRVGRPARDRRRADTAADDRRLGERIDRLKGEDD
jgi:hypothetical protein